MSAQVIIAYWSCCFVINPQAFFDCFQVIVSSSAYFSAVKESFDNHVFFGVQNQAYTHPFGVRQA